MNKPTASDKTLKLGWPPGVPSLYEIFRRIEESGIKYPEFEGERAERIEEDDG